MRRVLLKRELMLLVCGALIFSACQKEVGTGGIDQTETGSTVPSRIVSGVVEDDPEMVARIPLLMSSTDGIMAAPTRKGGGKNKDSDGDGIPDSSDACPTQKETVNGYQDTDGCPDTAPAPTTSDTDGDGIPDTTDACPSQKETFNGYQDTDGCPDTIPDTDKDGIDDLKDACPTSPETFNGYEDADGCPDTEPIVLPPTPVPASHILLTPTPGNQGNEGSCVPFAVAYGARSIEQFYRTGATAFSISSNVFSPEFAYNLTKISDCGSGTSVVNVLDLLATTGVCTWQSMPYSDVNGCSVMPSGEQLSTAGNFKIGAYVKVLNSDETAIKALVASKHPVIATILADNSFVNAKTGFIWKTYSGAGNLPHTIVICGYDDSKNAYKILNSYGTGWGDAGYSWIDYDFFPQRSSSYVFAIQ